MIRCWKPLLPLLAFTSISMGQNVGAGQYDLGSYDNKGFDTINLGNLNQHFEIPIVKKKGRGQDFNYSIIYDGLIWSTKPTPGGGTSTWIVDPTFGFHGQLNGGITGYYTYSQSPDHTCSGTGISAIKRTNYQFHDSVGAVHVFNYAETDVCGGGVTIQGDGSTSDNSGYSYSGGVITSRNGLRISAVLGSGGSTYGTIDDTNGNRITINADGNMTDTTNSTALGITGGATAASPLVLSYPVANQSNASTKLVSATVFYKAYTVQSAFQCSGIVASGPQSVNLIDHIVLPDASNSTYTFVYEAISGQPATTVTGRLTSVTLPGGGTITYAYSGGCAGGINGDGTPQTMARTTSDGTKTYSRDIRGYPVTITHAYDEANNRTDYTFEFSTDGNVYEGERQVFAGNPSSGATPLYDRSTFYNNQTSFGQVTSPITEADAFEVYNGSNGGAGTKQLRTNNSYTASGLLTQSTALDTAAGTIQITQAKYQYNGAGGISSATTYDAAGKLVTSTTYGPDESAPTGTTGLKQHVAAQGTRGNITSMHVMTASGSTLNSSYTYDDAGQLLTSTAPDGGQTSYTYDSTDTFPITVALPTPSSGIALATSASYDTTSGALLSQTGYNQGQTTTVTQYDQLLRPTIITPPLTGAQTTISYTPTQVTTSSKRDSTSTHNTRQVSGLDAYGRPNRTATWNGGSYYIVDSCYGPVGSLQSTGAPYDRASLPTTQSCSGGGAYQYDALGRPISVTRADGSSTTWQYNNRAVKQTDSPGTSKITQMDLIGRVTGVCEVSSTSMVSGTQTTDSPSSCGMDIAGNGYLTSYAYDLVNHKVNITQGVQATRMFQTDMAGRQTVTTEPESGTTTYSYPPPSATGQSVTRTRPRANQTNASVTTATTTQYDKLGRIVSVTYNDGSTPTKSFTYDLAGNGGSIPSAGSSKGQLIQMSNGVHGRSYAYDIMGRVTQTVECLPDWCTGPTSRDVDRLYTYDWVGNLITDQYADKPAGARYQSVTYAFNAAGQLTSVGGGQNNAASPFLYSVTAIDFAGPQTASFGNGLTATTQYDAVSRVKGRWLCSGATGVNCPGGTYLFGFVNAQSGNQVQSISDTVNNHYNDYTYDDLGRLTGASSHTGYTNGISYAATYDRYGNRWSQTVSNTGGTNPPQTSFSYITTKNQISGLGYDAAGNLINDTIAHTYQYDAENNLITIDNGSTATYTYNEFNQRQKASVGGVNERYGLDLSGRRSTVWNDSNVMTQAKYYNDLGPIAFWALADGNIHFEHQDNLGTERMRSDVNGNVEASYQTLPFGEQVGAAGTDASSNHFALLDQDLGAGAGLSHAMFREYSSVEGRWTSSDPDQGSYDLGAPQSLNRYGYASNSPLTWGDPLGTDPCVIGMSVNDGPNSCSVEVGDEWGWSNVGFGGPMGNGIGSPGTGIGSTSIGTQNYTGPKNPTQAPSSAPNVPKGVCAGAAVAGGASAGALIGGEVGGVLGAIVGGGGGTLVAPGVGTIGGGIAGASAGSGIGAVVGGFIGGLVGGAGSNVLCSQGAGPSFGGNQRENKQANDAKNEAERITRKKFTRAQERVFHDEITGQNEPYHELVKIAVRVLQGVI